MTTEEKQEIVNIAIKMVGVQSTVDKKLKSFGTSVKQRAEIEKITDRLHELHDELIMLASTAEVDYD